MSLEHTKRLLGQAERHIEAGQTAVDRQRKIISTLEREGHDSVLAKRLLSTLERTLALYEADRDRLRPRVARESL
jgi:hypothetical protein